MKQLELENMDAGFLPDGTEIKVGDIVLYEMGSGNGITRIIMHCGKLSLEENFLYGDKISVGHVLTDGCNRITKMSLVDVYKYYKERGWDVGSVIAKFGKK